MAVLLLVAGLQMAWGQYAMKVWNGSSYQTFRVDNVDSVQFVKLVSSLRVYPTSVTLEKGETVQLTATAQPEDASEPTVTWESSNQVVATVSASGLVAAVGKGSCDIKASVNDGSGWYAMCSVTVTSSDDECHDWVDLGLPSGTLWATANIGADSPELIGDKFAWGETAPKETYSWETYKYSEGTFRMLTKYCSDSQYGNDGFTDTLTELQPEDDAATVNWASEWQMPSKAQVEELYNSEYMSTESTWTGGVSGCKITSLTNANSIFLPEETGKSYTSYWSRSLHWYPDEACCIYVSGYISWFNSERYWGFPVRPVRKQSTTR